MKYRIVQYIQPWEIDNFERQVHHMILSSYYIDNPKNVIWDVTMNLSIIDWDASKLDKAFFIDKFNYLRQIVGYYFTTEFDCDESIQGCTDKRRVCAEKEQDFTIWLDSDIFFPQNTLTYFIQAAEQIKEESFILTPEIVRWWDESWDCIVNERFLNEPLTMRMEFDIYSLERITTESEISLKRNQNLKFGGGWFTLLSKKVTDIIKIPAEFGAYAADDTYLMLCGTRLGIPQYVLQGIVISEMSTRFIQNKDYIKPLLSVTIQDKQKISDLKFEQLVKKFYEEC